MRAMIATLVAAMGLLSCAAPSKLSQQTQGSVIGVIDWMPKTLLRNHYGVLPGLSQWHASYPAPFDTGSEFAREIVQQINSSGRFRAVLIPTPEPFEAVRVDSSRAGDKTYVEMPAWYTSKDQVKPGYARTLAAVAKEYGVGSFIITAPVWAPPHLNLYLNAPGYAASVMTKNHTPMRMSYVMFNARCLAFKLDDLQAENVCGVKDNSIELKDYAWPETSREPLPRMEEITGDLHTLIKNRAAVAAQVLQGDNRNAGLR